MSCVITETLCSMHPTFGTSLKKHPFVDDSDELKYKSFDGNDEKGFSLRLTQTEKLAPNHLASHYHLTTARFDFTNYLN